MSRYIDMDAVICDLHTAPNNLRWDMEDIEFWIESQPTADVVEVVRCKDCIWYLKDGSCARHLKQFESYDFCSYGERGDSDDD